ncbi:MAG: c-type cytochrome [Rhizobiales bacterium]|nr:c-type cytochrome [Hyphomicrobiales bacterium]
MRLTSLRITCLIITLVTGIFAMSAATRAQTPSGPATIGPAPGSADISDHAGAEAPPEAPEDEPASAQWSYQACSGPGTPVVTNYLVVPGAHIPGAVVEPLVDTVFDAKRGAAIFADQEAGNCIACHQVTPPEGLVAMDDAATAALWSAQGTLGPALDGVADRYSRAELRFILLEPERAFDDPLTVKPAYHRIEGLNNVASACIGRPALSAYAIEDLVAFLSLLRK